MHPATIRKPVLSTLTPSQIDDPTGSSIWQLTLPCQNVFGPKFLSVSSRRRTQGTIPITGGARARVCATCSARPSPGCMLASSFGRRRHTDAPADALVHPTTIRTPIYSTSLQARLMFRPDHLSGRTKSPAFCLPSYPARAHPSAASKAFGPRISVGIISVPNPQYDPEHWWRSSEGVRDVLGESVAWVYARFFFWPGPAAPAAPAGPQDHRTTRPQDH